jgi:regulatory protein
VTSRRETAAERRARRGEVDDPATVLDAAARFLEARPRSTAEVRRRLGEAGYQADLVEGAIARMVTLGYLDDEAFARAWIESRDRARPRGARALRAELRRKGVADDVVATVIEDRSSSGPGEHAATDGGEDPDDVAARRLLERRGAPVRREVDPRRRRARAYALLARNGFDPDVAGRAVAAWLAAAAPEADE